MCTAGIKQAIKEVLKNPDKIKPFILQYKNEPRRKKMIAKKIAGRGELGHLNWGADFSRSKKVLEKELKELNKHIGKKVLLTGGGGSRASYHILIRAWIERISKGKWGLQAELKPGITEWQETFTPWLDSWQISIIER